VIIRKGISQTISIRGGTEIKTTTLQALRTQGWSVSNRKGRGQVTNNQKKNSDVIQGGKDQTFSNVGGGIWFRTGKADTVGNGETFFEALASKGRH